MCQTEVANHLNYELCTSFTDDHEKKFHLIKLA